MIVCWKAAVVAQQRARACDQLPSAGAKWEPRRGRVGAAVLLSCTVTCRALSRTHHHGPTQLQGTRDLEPHLPAVVLQQPAPERGRARPTHAAHRVQLSHLRVTNDLHLKLQCKMQFLDWPAKARSDARQDGCGPVSDCEVQRSPAPQLKFSTSPCTWRWP